ncbi:MAG TPA: tetraacyldisaccharide 4'-kinase [Terriglobales bacterium]|nr:tetraacyldisaccharide 4'-kinase [Terriglobales bacterium]
MATFASQIFGALVAARERGYASGRLGVARLPRPVLSVGNLRVGGSGKTPAVIALGLACGRAGVRCDVLSRGYRRAHNGMAVALNGNEAVEEVGDEPRLIAQRLGVPVMVHPDRFRSGLEAERRFSSQLHLLDDGFQHRQLARAFDLVLVAPEDITDRLLPAGRLREPPAALARADAVAWVDDWHDSQSAPQSALQAARERLAPWTTAPVFLARKRPVPAAAADITPQHPLAFCGLARPDSFWRTLRQLGIAPAAELAFRDHYHYTVADLRRLRARARAAGADGFCTTAKDAMNLPHLHPLHPLRIVEVEMEFADLGGLLHLALTHCGLLGTRPC